jgi:formylglycine-generating enzyme required for sulfatase activity
MRVPSLIGPSALLGFMIASSAAAVSMDWTPIGNPGNGCDPQPQGCFGAVAYSYSIGTYEVTNAQYAEFLNAKAASDPYGLYTTNMNPGAGLNGGIARAGSSGSYTYLAASGRESMPVNHVSFFDALRFANWMNNGQGSGDTETGAYSLYGGASQYVVRNQGATIVLSSENEWYKAAYYDSDAASYFDYPTASDVATICATATAGANRANCANAVGDFTMVGSYTGSPSPYGTFDQAGNVAEWNESIISMGFNSLGRGIRGGDYSSDPYFLAASTQSADDPSFEYRSPGFRLVMIPEPGTRLLVFAGLLGLASWRRTRDRRHHRIGS